MGYNMKRGNSGVKFRELGSSPAKQVEVDDDVVPYEGSKVSAGNAPGTGTAKVVVEGAKQAWKAADKVSKATKDSKTKEAEYGTTGRKI